MYNLIEETDKNGSKLLSVLLICGTSRMNGASNDIWTHSCKMVYELSFKTVV